MRNLWCLEKISILPFIISATGRVPQPLFKNLKISDLENTLVVPIEHHFVRGTSRGIQKAFRWRFSASNNFYYFRNMLATHTTRNWRKKNKQKSRQIKFIFKVNVYFFVFPWLQEYLK
jgi:hypothetical protein